MTAEQQLPEQRMHSQEPAEGADEPSLTGMTQTREGDGGMEGTNEGMSGGMGATSTTAGQGMTGSTVGNVEGDAAGQGPGWEGAGQQKSAEMDDGAIEDANPMPGLGPSQDIPDGDGGTVTDVGESQPMSPAEGAPPAGDKDEADDLANGMEPPD